MVGSFCFVLHSQLAGIAGRNKLLINMKAHLQRCAFCFAFIWFKVQGSGFRVEGSRSGFAAFFIGRCSKVAFKSPVTSHSYDTREGIVSHVWCQILRLSPHLFWLFFSHIERFHSLRMTIREGGWALIWLSVKFYSVGKFFQKQ